MSMTQADVTHISNFIDNKITGNIAACRISIGNELEALMDRKDQAAKDMADTGIIKLDQGITDVLHGITTAGEFMQQYLALADKRFTDVEGLQKQKRGQVSAEFATRSVKVESLSQVMDRINAVEEHLNKADKVVDKMGQSKHQMEIDYDNLK